MNDQETIFLKDFEAFNRFFFRSCYFHQMLACYKYFGVKPEYVIANYLNLYVRDEGSNELTTKEQQIFSQQEFEAYTGIRQLKYIPKQNICQELIKRLQIGSPSIIIIDYYYLPFRKELYKKVHIDHYISICGVDFRRRQFQILELNSDDDMRYGKHFVSFEVLRIAFEKGLICMKTGRDPFVTFEKISEINFKNYVKDTQKRYKQYKTQIKSSYRILAQYLSVLFREKLCCDPIRAKSLDDLRWQKIRQKYQMCFVYKDKKEKLGRAFRKIINGYAYLSAHFSDSPVLNQGIALGRIISEIKRGEQYIKKVLL
ncbi:MAG TPA: BtrH N-terminal domain-containing protein [[Clostridium] spiroforme]|uniref:BtrH N-terminal domain-containing protein n=1 Tax=Thomasclavelia spiroformis TaxID=29348 RepID=A0A921KJP4_9FIRM|nr:BtrH N-terminal domain-containing protein [Thomasclavelia spiroformis]